MDESTKQLLIVLEDTGLEVHGDGSLPSFADQPATVLEQLLPRHYLSYDLECIDGLEDYGGLLLQFAAATNGVWNVRNVEVSANQRGKVKLTFESNGKSAVLQFGHDGSDWVSGEFLKAINRYAARELRGSFVELPITDSWERVIYLPAEAAKKVRRLLEKRLSVDALIEHFRKAGSFDEPGAYYEALPLFDKRSKSGDTPLAAVINAKNEEYAMWLLDMGVRPVCDSRGRTPLEMAKEYGLHHLQRWLESNAVMHAIAWEDAGSERRKHPSAYDKRVLAMIAAIRVLDGSDKIFPVCDELYGTICLGRTDVFEYGKDTLAMFIEESGWLVCYDTTAPYYASYERHCPDSEVMECVKEYVRRGGLR